LWREFCRPIEVETGSKEDLAIQLTEGVASKKLTAALEALDAVIGALMAQLGRAGSLTQKMCRSTGAHRRGELMSVSRIKILLKFEKRYVDFRARTFLDDATLKDVAFLNPQCRVMRRRDAPSGIPLHHLCKKIRSQDSGCS
jgi:hypothetical protein